MRRYVWGALLGVSLVGVSADARAAKTLVYCSEGAPETLNPALSTSGTAIDAGLPIFDTLVAFERGGTKIVPALARAWTISQDGLVYTFQLRADVKFHPAPGFTPSRTLNADDVVFTINRQLKPDHPFHKVSGGTYDYFNDMGLPGLIRSVERVDDLTVRFTLNHPEAPFIADLAMPLAVIGSADYADAMAKAGTPERVDLHPVGTGAFQFVHQQKDAVIRYKAFDGHWGGRTPADQLVFAITPDAAVRYAKIKVGECHVAPYPNPAELAMMAKDPKVALVQGEGMNIGYVAFNVTRKPFDDVRVRRAITMAVDRAAIVRAVYQEAGVVAKNPIPPTMWSYNDHIVDTPFDPAAARTLLAEAGLPNGFETELWAMPVQRPYNPNARRMAEMIQADLAKIGVTVKIVSREWGEYRKRVQAGEASMAMLGWVGDNGDPDNFLHTLLGCDAARVGGGNIAKWCDAGFDDLVVTAKRLSDPAERAKLYAQAQVIFAEARPWITVAHSKTFMMLNPKVRGYALDPFGLHRFNGVDLAP